MSDPVIEHAIPGWLHEVIPLAGAILIVVVGRALGPPLPAPSVAGEAAAGAALFGGRLALQVAGRVLVARAPMLVAMVASAFGYAAGEEHGLDGDGGGWLPSTLHSLRPILAAIIAIVVGEPIGRLIRRWRGGSAPQSEGA